MKIGDKIICIDDSGKGITITKNKEYKVYYVGSIIVAIVDDYGDFLSYPNYRFEGKQQHRKNKLKKLNE